MQENKLDPTPKERLEFLGDSILSFWVSDYLYHAFPNYTEGELSILRSLIIREEHLANIARKVGLDRLIVLSKGEEKNKGRGKNSILADTFECLLGGLYLDQGYPVVQKWLQKILPASIQKFSHLENQKDPKTTLQELVQSMFSTLPVYEVVQGSRTGKKLFTVAVTVNKEEIARAKGGSIQKAEIVASQQAIELLQKSNG